MLLTILTTINTNCNALIVSQEVLYVATGIRSRSNEKAGSFLRGDTTIFK